MSKCVISVCVYVCVCVTERKFRSRKGSSVLVCGEEHCGTVNILLTQVLVRKCLFASNYSMLQYL